MTNDEATQLMTILTMSGMPTTLNRYGLETLITRTVLGWKLEDECLMWYECAAMVKKMLLDYKREPDGSLSLEKNVED